MNIYPVVEALLVAVALVFSADQALRSLAPAVRQTLLGWLARRLGLTVRETQSTAGCGSGCGACSTGCSGPTTARTPPPAEQPLSFVRKISPPAK